jgi:hypothetical protein
MRSGPPAVAGEEDLSFVSTMKFLGTRSEAVFSPYSPMTADFLPCRGPNVRQRTKECNQPAPPELYSPALTHQRPVVSWTALLRGRAFQSERRGTESGPAIQLADRW